MKVINIAKETIIDFPKYVRLIMKKKTFPSNRFVIFAEGRSGSTLLVSLLNSSNQIYCDGEILNRAQVAFPQQYIDLKASFCRTPVYGFKLLDYQLEKLHRIKNPELFLVNLHKRGYKFIYLRRRNRLYHALSQINALKKNKFHKHHHEGEQTYQPIWVNVKELMDTMKITDKTTYKYQMILNDVPHLNLYYEEDLQCDSVHQSTADRIFRFLDIPSTPVKGDLVKIMPRKLSDIVKNYDEVVNTVKQTQYSRFLDSE